MFSRIDTSILKEKDPMMQWYRDADNGRDLFVWFSDVNKIIRFQVWQGEELLEWDVHKKIRTGTLDGASGSFENLQSPTYKYHSRFRNDSFRLFNFLLDGQAMEGLPKSVFSFVATMLKSA